MRGCTGSDIVSVPAQFVNALAGFTNPVTVQAESLAAAVKLELARGRQVIMVPHSHGNMLVQQALNALTNGGGALTAAERGCVSTVSLAPPTTAGWAPWATRRRFFVEGALTGDFLLGLLYAPLRIRPDAEIWTTSRSDSTDRKVRDALPLLSSVYHAQAGLQLHDVVDSYLRGDRTKGPIARALQEQSAAMAATCTSASNAQRVEFDQVVAERQHTLYLAPGERAHVKATVFGVDGARLSNRLLTWTATSRGPTAGTVTVTETADGATIAGVTPGDVQIEASAGDPRKRLTVIVASPVPLPVGLYTRNAAVTSYRDRSAHALCPLSDLYRATGIEDVCAARTIRIYPDSTIIVTHDCVVAGSVATTNNCLTWERQYKLDHIKTFNGYPYQPTPCGSGQLQDLWPAFSQLPAPCVTTWRDVVGLRQRTYRGGTYADAVISRRFAGMARVSSRSSGPTVEHVYVEVDPWGFSQGAGVAITRVSPDPDHGRSATGLWTYAWTYTWNDGRSSCSGRMQFRVTQSGTRLSDSQGHTSFASDCWGAWVPPVGAYHVSGDVQGNNVEWSWHPNECYALSGKRIGSLIVGSQNCTLADRGTYRHQYEVTIRP